MLDHVAFPCLSTAFGLWDTLLNILTTTENHSPVGRGQWEHVCDPFVVCCLRLQISSVLAFDIGLHSDICRLFSFKLGVMIDTCKLYTMSYVWMTLTFI